MTDLYIAPWSKSKYLFTTSFLFLIPSAYSYYCQLYLYSSVLLLVSLASANYWRKATYGWRRNIDIICAKMSFALFFSSGVWYVRSIAYMIPGYSGLLSMPYCYYKSNIYYKNAAAYNIWLYYHMSFHFLLCCEQTLIIHSVHNYTKTITS
jgi:hypothetical protein